MNDYFTTVQRLRNIHRSLTENQINFIRYDTELEEGLDYLHKLHGQYYDNFFQTCSKKRKFRTCCVQHLKLLSEDLFFDESFHSCLVYFDFCWETIKKDINEKNIELYTNVLVLIATKFHQVRYLKLDDGWSDDEFIKKEHNILNHLQYRVNVITYVRVLEFINIHTQLPENTFYMLLQQAKIMATNFETPKNIVTITIEFVIKYLENNHDTQESNVSQHSKRAKKD